jgi:hypothetical protein
MVKTTTERPRRLRRRPWKPTMGVEVGADGKVTARLWFRRSDGTPMTCERMATPNAWGAMPRG